MLAEVLADSTWSKVDLGMIVMVSTFQNALRRQRTHDNTILHANLTILSVALMVLGSMCSAAY